MSAEQQVQFKSDLLVILQQEQSKNVRKKVADLVAEVSRNLMDEDGNNLWPEFLKFLFELASSPNPEMKEISLHLFSSVPQVFGNQEAHYLEVPTTTKLNELPHRTDWTYFSRR